MTREEIKAILHDVSDAGRGLVYSEPEKSRIVLEGVIEECRKNYRDFLPSAMNCYNCATQDQQKKREILTELIEIAEDLGDKFQLCLALMNLGTTEGDLGNHKGAILLYERDLKIIPETNASEDRKAMLWCGTTNNLTVSFTALGDSVSVSKYREMTLHWLPALKSERQKAYILNNIATDLANAGEFESAIPILETALVHARMSNDPAIEALVLKNAGLGFREMGRLTEAEDYLLSAIKMSEGIAITLCVALRAYSRLLLSTSRLEEAEEFLKKAESASIPFQHEYILVQREWGRLYHKKGEYERSKQYIHEAENAMLSRDIKAQLPELYGDLSAVYLALGDVRMAFDYLTKKEKVREELFNSQARKSLSGAQIILAIEREKHEAELSRIKAERAEEQLRLKERDLANTASSLAAQTELLGNFRADLRKIVLRPDRYEPEDIIKQVRNKLKELPCEMIDFSKFEGQFATVHPEFRAKLEMTYPELSPAEVKMCMLIHVKLQTPAIAKLMCLSERTVESHRLAIRKKLGLKAGEEIGKKLAGLM